MAAAAQAAAAGIADTPLLGWSSWSMESTTRPGFNPDGGGSWLTEANLFKQVDAVAKTLKPSGYQYVNIDAGWSRDITGGGWDALHFDANGREIASPQRFPDGMKPVADYIHGKGLKEGRHLPRGRHRHPGVRRWSNRDRRRSRLHDRRHRLPGPADDQRRSRRRRSTPVTT
jgi:hypothetical protein